MTTGPRPAPNDDPRTAPPWDRAAVTAALDGEGWTILPGLLDGRTARDIIALYPMDDRFRSEVDMARHGFGTGTYRYFAYPLPPAIATLRDRLYPPLAAVANAWQQRLGSALRFPDTHAAFLARCHAAGQTKPTPLLLRYATGDYNRLHRDLYGAHVFPLQVTVLLSSPGEDFAGGEFVLTEQRPRMQSRATVVPLVRGDGVVFATDVRPHRGTRGDHRVTMRHGVSMVRSGRRHALGIIFHDAA